MRLTFLLLLSLFIGNAFGQGNFVAANITTRQGETVSGEIDYQEWIVNPKTIRFRKNEGSAVQTFKPIDLKSFTIAQNQEQYVASEVYVNYEPVNGSIDGYTRSREIKTFETGTDFTKIDLVKDTIFCKY
ncbi:MAG: hypothetical protein HC892_13725 [Saprospiraceae bacterium]|nr:hypothetical protein [Saprospiraceae bacterium]